MMEPAGQTNDVVSFGPFTLLPSERLLTKQGAPVDLGARTLDTLIALLSRPSEVLTKRHLLAQVWPDVTVEEGSLRLQIAKLRKALGEGEHGARYIATLAGRGYSFVAPISRSNRRVEMTSGVNFQRTNLPGRLTGMIGRTHDVLMLSTQLTASRFVTIVGIGGVGKTALAVEVGHDLIERFAGAVLFVDLGALRDPKMLVSSVASMVGLSVQSDDAIPSLIAYLRDKRLLFILDNCEHLIEEAAALTSHIFVAAPQVHILTTSREALRVENEHVFKLAPLACPPDDPAITAATVQTFPAARLFVERAAASGVRLNLSDADAATVADICRKLDGLPLAIALAAGRIEAHGLSQIAALLDQRLSLLWSGQRTAPRRQKTLQATLDWSYGLLTEPEPVVLRRLGVFVGHFTIDAALTVATSTTVDQGAVFGAIDSLVAKSMVATDPVGAMMRYRLLDTTRAYVRGISVEDAERADLAARHAVFYRKWLEQIGPDTPSLSDAAGRMPVLDGLNNVRAALEWCFGNSGNARLGVELAAAAAPVFLAMSLLTECHRWSERAILALDDAARAGAEEMHLQTALGLSLMFTRGNSERALAALIRSLAIAEQRGDVASQVQCLGRLHLFHHRIGNFTIALQYAKRSPALIGITADPAAVALTHSLLGISLNYLGDLSGARAELEAALRQGQGSQPTQTIFHGVDHFNLAGAYLARTLWLQGYPTQAVERIRRTIKDASSLDHPVTLSIALMWSISLCLWAGNFRSAQEDIDRFVSHSETHSLRPHLAVARGFRGQQAIRLGNAGDGIECLRSCLEELRDARYEILTTTFNIALVQGLATLRRFSQAISLIDETIRLVEVNGDLSYMPELLRARGGLLLSKPEPNIAGAEGCFMRSLEQSRQQGARAWELRTAIDLAALWAAQGRPERSVALVKPIYEQFTEGFDTVDLKAAQCLLETLG